MPETDLGAIGIGGNFDQSAVGKVEVTDVLGTAHALPDMDFNLLRVLPLVSTAFE